MADAPPLPMSRAWRAYVPWFGSGIAVQLVGLAWLAAGLHPRWAYAATAVASFVLLIAGACAVQRDGRRHRADLAAGRCLACGYDLRATPGRCPECGAVPTGGAG